MAPPSILKPPKESQCPFSQATCEKASAFVEGMAECNQWITLIAARCSDRAVGTIGAFTLQSPVAFAGPARAGRSQAGARRSQEEQEPGGARRSQEELGRARRSQDQEEPGGAKRSREGPG